MSKATATVIAALVLAGSGAATGIASADPPAPPPPPPQAKTSIDNDGTYAVGSDIEPGTYSSAGPVGNGTCYWKRMSSPTGGDVIDSALSKKPQVVQIDAGDKAFKTDGCQPWQKTDSASADGGGTEASSPQTKALLDILNGYVSQLGGGH